MNKWRSTLLIGAVLVVVLTTSCSNGTRVSGEAGSPRTWIIYNNERYEEVEAYASKPDGLISTNTFTDGDDYEPNKEIFIDTKTNMLYTKDEEEWEKFAKK